LSSSSPPIPPRQTTGKALQIEVRDIDHLGIVAGIIDEIGLVEEIDRKLGTHPQERVSPGRATKAMILNGLGFLSAPLYLFGEFFSGKATEHLLGTGIEPEHLNDDRLGRVLDKLFEADLTEVFIGVASRAAGRFGVSTKSIHLDATSFHLHGHYDDEKPEDPKEIRVTYGYSREHRPDLKQFMVDLMSTGESGVPLFFRVADGNEADQTVFAELLKDFRTRLDLNALFVADSALYSAENLASLGYLRWLCRVPRTLGEARRVLAETPPEVFVESANHKGYRVAEIESDYGGVSQRWLVVHSEDLQKAASERLERCLLHREKELNRELSRLSHKTFACQADALQAVEAFCAEHLHKHHRLDEQQIITVARYGKRGRPARGTEPEEIRYRIKANLERDEKVIREELERSGRYLLATNVLSEHQELTNDELLSEYKERQSVERGFRFLKDPLFFTSSLFVKTPRRVAAIAMVMGLCLLVYTIGERSLRQALVHSGEGIRHQRGKPTSRPTLRWVFQLFQAVHILRVDGAKQISNLTEERRSILSFLGQRCQRYYLLS
jgi:transposase